MNYIFAWQEKSSILIGLAHQIASGKGASEAFNVDFQNHLVYFQNTQTHVYYSEEDIRKWETQSTNFLKKGYLNLFLAATKQFRDAFYTVINSIEIQNLGQYSDEDLLDLFNRYYSSIINITGIYLGTQPEGVYNVDIKLKNLLRDHYKEDQVEQIYNTICTAYEFDITQKEKIDWLKIIKEGKDSDRDFIAHAKKYPAFFFNTYSFDSVTKYLKSRFQKEDISSLEKEVADLYEDRESILKERTKILSALPEQITHLSDVLRDLSVDRFKMKNCWSGAELLALKLFQEMSKRIGINIEDLFASYTQEDIWDFLIQGTKVSEEEIKNRKEMILYKREGDKLLFLTGNEAQKEVEKIFGKRDFNVGRVSGMTANGGKISGKARVVLVEGIDSFMEASEAFKEGDILVTTMTSPNMVLLMNKAGGVVTNEGGVCSHAAVVAREMKVPRKKPCIIGTKDATRVFQTGDYILLNGDTGEVIKVDKEYHLKNIKDFELALETVEKSSYVRVKKTLNPVVEKNILFLSEISGKDLPSVGGKGANLGELYKTFNVPNAFCVTTFAYNNFKKELKDKIGNIIDSLNYENIRDLSEKSSKIQETIMNNSLPKQLEDEIKSAYKTLSNNRNIKVSVRSSATAEDLPEASFAGQQETFLEVEGLHNILSYIKQCFASLYNSRAIIYRNENHVSENDISMSVVVQIMVDVYCAGVAFSVNPITGNKNELVIDAALGVGENVVSGKVTPDNYIILKSAKNIKKTVAGDKQVISNKKLYELSQTVVAIEEYYKYPQDVEWAVDNKDEIFILQSRPITTV